MAMVTRLGKLSHRLLAKSSSSLHNSHRCASDYEKFNIASASIWLPDPYPTTEEARRKAAEKYNLHVDEYEPYPDKGEDAVGDYPKLPKLSTDTRDPFYPWDIPAFKRNFCEPLHREAEVLGEDRSTVGVKHKIPLWQAPLYFFGTVLGIIGLSIITNAYPMFQPAFPKQYPNDGIVHYTFEPAH